MKKFVYIFCEYICPISLIIGNISLIILGFRIFDFEEGWIATVSLLVYWEYGYIAHCEIVPFIKKHLFRLRRKPTP